MGEIKFEVLIPNKSLYGTFMQNICKEKLSSLSVSASRKSPLRDRLK